MSHVGSTTYEKIMKEVEMLNEMAEAGSDQALEDLDQLHVRLSGICIKLLRNKAYEQSKNHEG